MGQLEVARMSMRPLKLMVAPGSADTACLWTDKFSTPSGHYGKWRVPLCLMYIIMPSWADSVLNERAIGGRWWLRVAFYFYIVIIACGAFILESNVHDSLVFYWAGSMAAVYLVSLSMFFFFMHFYQGDIQQLLILEDPQAAARYCVDYIPNCDSALPYSIRALTTREVSTAYTRSDDLPFNSVISFSPGW